MRPLWNDLEKVVSSAQFGDTIRLMEGTHRMPAMWVQDLHFEGVGDPRAIILEGAFEVRGQCSFQNFTIKAPEDRCPVVVEPGAQARLRVVAITQVPSTEFVGVFAKDAKLEMEACTVFSAEFATSVKAENSTVKLVNTHGEKVEVHGGVSTLDNCVLSHIDARDRAQVENPGMLTLKHVAGKRGFVVEDQAQLTIGALHIMGADSGEGYVNDAQLRIGSVTGYTVIFKGECDLQLPNTVTTVDKNPKGPKVIEWRPEQG